MADNLNPFTLDVEKLRSDFVAALKKRGHTDADIAAMTPEEAFGEYCTWHGLLGWGPKLWAAVMTAQQASVRADNPESIAEMSAQAGAKIRQFAPINLSGVPKRNT